MYAAIATAERSVYVTSAYFVVIDGVCATVGSSNMDWRSFLHNAEANVVIVVDRRFGAEMESMFFRDIGASQELTYEAWLRRGWLARCSEWFARKLEILL